MDEDRLTKGKQYLKINRKLMPEYIDDRLGSDVIENPPALDASSMGDDDFENMEQVPVLDYNNRIVGYRSEVRRKRRKIT